MGTLKPTRMPFLKVSFDRTLHEEAVPIAPVGPWGYKMVAALEAGRTWRIPDPGGNSYLARKSGQGSLMTPGLNSHFHNHILVMLKHNSCPQSAVNRMQTEMLNDAPVQCLALKTYE